MSKEKFFKCDNLSESLKFNKKSGFSPANLISYENGHRSAIMIALKYPKIIYYEAVITTDEGFARFGVAKSNFEVNGPIGMDENSYGIGNKNGYGFHNGKRKYFGERFFKNDILSCLVHKVNQKKILNFYINGVKIKNEFILPKDDFWPAFSVCHNCCIDINFGPCLAYQEKIFLQENITDY